MCVNPLPALSALKELQTILPSHTGVFLDPRMSVGSPGQEDAARTTRPNPEHSSSFQLGRMFVEFYRGRHGGVRDRETIFFTVVSGTSFCFPQSRNYYVEVNHFSLLNHV